MKRGLDRARETIFFRRLAKYHDFSHIYGQALRVHIVNYDISCEVGEACFSPERESACFPQSGRVGVPKRTPKTVPPRWGNLKFNEKHHAKTPNLLKL